MTLKGKSRTRQARGDILKANARARQRAQARTQAKGKFDRKEYDGHSQVEVNDGA
jgi:hypothetical protein